MRISFLTIIVCSLASIQVQSGEYNRSVQLYLYLSPSPKWGYIAEATKPQEEVQFYECNEPKPILVNRSKLKEVEGLCENRKKADGPWIVKYDPNRKQFVALDSDTDAPVFFTKEELFGGAEASPEFTQGAFGVAVEGNSRKVFRVEGKNEQ